MGSHMHWFKIDIGDERSHSHRISGYTEGTLGLNSIHFHFFSGISSYNSHTHYFSGMTGLPIKTDNGHVHRMESVLENDLMHEHKFRGYTSEDVAYNNNRPQEAFI